MKRKFLLLTIALSFAATLPSYAAETESVKGIQFRDIPWHSTKAEAEKILFSDPGVSANQFTDDEIYRLGALDFYNVVSGDDYVKGGGVKVSYNGVTVAGYTPSDCHACYVFPITDQGYVNPSEDDAQFYLGWYGFSSNDFADIPGIYTDLEKKLTSLYGDPAPASDDFKKTDTWSDQDGNTIELLQSAKNTYVQLGYIAPDADQLVDQAKAALEKAQAESEQEAREANASNTDGL